MSSDISKNNRPVAKLFWLPKQLWNAIWTSWGVWGMPPRKVGFQLWSLAGKNWTIWISISSRLEQVCWGTPGCSRGRPNLLKFFVRDLQEPQNSKIQVLGVARDRQKDLLLLDLASPLETNSSVTKRGTGPRQEDVKMCFFPFSNIRAFKRTFCSVAGLFNHFKGKLNKATPTLNYDDPQKAREPAKNSNLACRPTKWWQPTSPIASLRNSRRF